MSELLHESLWSANLDLAQRCREHPFVKGLEDGSLDEGAFRAYVAQDAFFLRAFARGYAVAAARSETIDEIASFHRLLGGVLEELATHERFARELRIDIANVRPFAETLAYTDFLGRTAWERDLGELLAAMAPCMRLYAWLGSELAKGGVPGHRYRAWIETYSADGFEELAASLEGHLDRCAADTPPVREAYRRALRCELDFFSAPLDPAKREDAP